MSILDEVKRVSQMVTNNTVDQMRLEEELLTVYIKRDDVSLKSKKEVLDRLAVINRKQLEAFGQRIKWSA